MSARDNMAGVHAVFELAARAVTCPISPLIDAHTASIKTEFAIALRRVFRVCDRDRDGLLNTEELNAFQHKCFGVTLNEEEARRIFQEMSPSGAGAVEAGINEEKFQKLILMFVMKNRASNAWAVLQTYNYDENVQLQIPEFRPRARAADQVVELNDEGIAFLAGIFTQFAGPEGRLTDGAIEDIFSIAPGGRHPWDPSFPLTTQAGAPREHCMRVVTGRAVHRARGRDAGGHRAGGGPGALDRAVEVHARARARLRLISRAPQHDGDAR